MNTEHYEQVLLVAWFRKTYDHLIFAIPNGGKRHRVAAMKLKQEGVISGIPDLYVPALRLWVEMKRSKGGKLSENQKKIKSYLESLGDNYIVGHGYEDAKQKISAALGEQL